TERHRRFCAARLGRASPLRGGNGTTVLATCRARIVRATLLGADLIRRARRCRRAAWRGAAAAGSVRAWRRRDADWLGLQGVRGRSSCSCADVPELPFSGVALAGAHLSRRVPAWSLAGTGDGSASWVGGAVVRRGATRSGGPWSARERCAGFAKHGWRTRDGWNRYQPVLGYRTHRRRAAGRSRRAVAVRHGFWPDVLRPRAQN